MEQQNKIERLKPDAIIQVKFNRDFYQRLVLLLRFIYESKNEQELVEAAKQIEEKKITEPWILHYETMLYLLKGAEEYAQQNNLTEFIDLETYRRDLEAEQDTPPAQ